MGTSYSVCDCKKLLKYHKFLESGKLLIPRYFERNDVTFRFLDEKTLFSKVSPGLLNVAQKEYETKLRKLKEERSNIFISSESDLNQLSDIIIGLSFRENSLRRSLPYAGLSLLKGENKENYEAWLEVCYTLNRVDYDVNTERKKCYDLMEKISS